MCKLARMDARVVTKDQFGYVRLLVLVPCSNIWRKLLNLALAPGYFLGCLEINGTEFEVDLRELFAVYSQVK